MTNRPTPEKGRIAVPSAPEEIDVSLTGRCNLACRYCFYADEMAALEDLPARQWMDFFSEAGGIGVQRLTLSGGEVFTRPDLFILIDSLIENRMRYSILTNGTLIDQKVISAFDGGKRRLRLDSIQVSIDGSCAAVHDASRPPASFERALRGLRLLKAEGFPVTVRVTINRHNVRDLPAIARLLLDDVGLRSFGTNSADRFGSARCYGQDVVLNPEEWDEAVRILQALVIQYPGRIRATAGPLAFAEDMERIGKAMAEGLTGLPGRGRLSACGGVFSKMAVLHDGSMTPCNMLPGLVMGKIGETAVQEAWLRGRAIRGLRERYETPITSIPGCGDCRFAGFCTGGCPAVVYAQHGTLHAVNREHCCRSHFEGRNDPV
ncbi:radical SAM protein [bacterium]|nr:radical SAM protein [bacterium]